MSNKLILIIKPNGEEVRRYIHGFQRVNDTISFYFTSEVEAPMLQYPTYTSGKCKGPIAFKKDGTLVLSEELYNTIKEQNGYLRDGMKIVDVHFNGLIIRYEKKKFYDYYLVELLKSAMERDIGHIHSLESLHERHVQLYNLWEDFQTNTKLSIEVKSRPQVYDFLTIQGFYVGNSYELNQLIKHFGFKDGEQEFDFRTPIKTLKEESFSYNASAMGWV